MSSDRQQDSVWKERRTVDGQNKGTSHRQSNEDSRHSASLLNQAWYWFQSTREEVDHGLAGKSDGSFVVVDGSVQGNFTLIVRKDGSNKRIRIIKRHNGYSLSSAETETSFATLPDLVDFYGHNSLAALNKNLDVCLCHAVKKTVAVKCSQYVVFKELYDLSQEELSAHTRLSILKKQQAQLDKNVKMVGTMLPALRIVRGMYYENIKQQEEESGPQSQPDTRQAVSFKDTSHPSHDVCIHNDDLVESKGKDRLSRDDEKRLTSNAALLFSRHTALSKKLNRLKAQHDEDSANLRQVKAEKQHLKLTVLNMERRQKELRRLLTDMGCHEDFLGKVLEPMPATREFDRSQWLMDCTREGAQDRLEGLPHGTFVVRSKNQRPLPYVLSIVVCGDSGQQQVQHCYIVRPKGRGYGFNPALAVFESVDQLVLRHRHVSLRHYFKDMDVTLSFPLGCQQLLGRSLSECEKEDEVRVDKGGYANAAVIWDCAQEDGDNRACSGAAETAANPCRDTDTSSLSSPPVPSFGLPQKFVKVPESNDASSCPLRQHKENKYECVESCEDEGLDTASSTGTDTDTIYRDHVYEAVDYSQDTPDSVNTSYNRINTLATNRITHVIASESRQPLRAKCGPAIFHCDKAAKKHEYDSLATPEACDENAGFTARTDTRQSVTEHIYEDVDSPRDKSGPGDPSNGDIELSDDESYENVPAKKK